MLSKRGNLNIKRLNPANTVEDDKFGLIYRIKPSAGKSVYLYAKPPEKKLLSKIKNQQPVPVDASAYPAMLMDANREDGIFVHKKLEKDERVIARAVYGRDDLLEVATYRSVGVARADMPESGREIEITNKGYIEKSQAVKDISAAESFKKDKRELFPNEDLIGDVNQSIFGDCFLLSSILGILHKKPEGSGQEFIKGMMRQIGDYVVVRLFDPNTNQPVYINVKNSYYCQNGNSTVTHKAPWVHVLEKAYTALALQKRSGIRAIGIDKYNYTFPSFQEMFGKGGDTDTAMLILTGQPAADNQIRCVPAYPWHSDSLLYSMMLTKRLDTVIREFKDDGMDGLDNFLAGKTKEYLRPLQKILDKNGSDPETILREFSDQLKQGNDNHEECDQLLRLIRQAIAGKDKETQAEIISTLATYFDEYIKLRIDSPLPVSNLLTKIRQILRLGKYVDDVMTAKKWDELVSITESVTSYEDAYNFINRVSNRDPKMPEDLLEIFRGYVQDAHLRWNGPLANGHYTEATLKVFDDIRLRIDAGYAVSASTLPAFPRQVDGLRSKHAYSVAGVYTNGKDKFVQIRNPWGNTGRRYEFDRLGVTHNIAKEDAKLATFDVELSDFVKYFEKYTVGQLPTAEQMAALPPYPEPPIPEKGFFRRHWKAITATTVSFAAAGLTAGAGLGVAAAVFGLAPTFGLSMLAIPVFAGIGFVAGAAAGFVAGVTGSLIADSCRGGKRKKTSQGKVYESLPINVSQESSPESSPKLMRKKLAENEGALRNSADSLQSAPRLRSDSIVITGTENTELSYSSSPDLLLSRSKPQPVLNNEESGSRLKLSGSV